MGQDTRYYLKSTNLINILEFQQNRIIQILGKLSDLIRDIRNENPDMDYKQAADFAKPYLPKELEEIEKLQQTLPSDINKLSDFKLQAVDILKSMESLKV